MTEQDVHLAVHAFQEGLSVLKPFIRHVAPRLIAD
jgi:hypothetical protein